MIIRILLFVVIVAAMALFGLEVHAQGNEAFWQNYYAAQGGFYGGGNNLGNAIAQQRSTEALINEMRRQHGLPPCSIGLLGQWMGRPAC